MKTKKLTGGTRGLLNIKEQVCGCEREAGGIKDSAQIYSNSDSKQNGPRPCQVQSSSHESLVSFCAAHIQRECDVYHFINKSKPGGFSKTTVDHVRVKVLMAALAAKSCDLLIVNPFIR